MSIPLLFVNKIVMWEVFAEKKPYYFLPNPQAVIKHVYYDKGRPDLEELKGDIAPEIIELMTKNWAEEINNRMEFKEIVKVLMTAVYNNKI